MPPMLFATQNGLHTQWTLVPVDFCFLRAGLAVERHRGQVSEGGAKATAGVGGDKLQESGADRALVAAGCESNGFI